MPRLLRTCLAAAFVVLSIAPTPAVADDGCYYRENEKRFMSELNDRRDNNGKSRLTWDLSLARVARHHSYKMAGNGGIYHNLAHNGGHLTNWVELGEIIGKVSHKDTDEQSVNALVNAFMASDAHRAIILAGDWNYIGAGTVKGENYLWVTVLFEREGNPGTTFHGC